MNKHHEKESKFSTQRELSPEKLNLKQKKVLADTLKDPDNFIIYLYPKERESIMRNQLESEDVFLLKLLAQTINQVIAQSDQEYSDSQVEKCHIWQQLEIGSKSESEIDKIVDQYGALANQNLADSPNYSSIASRFSAMLEAYKSWKSDSGQSEEELKDFIIFRDNIREKVCQELSIEDLIKNE